MAKNSGANTRRGPGGIALLDEDVQSASPEPEGGREHAKKKAQNVDVKVVERGGERTAVRENREEFGKIVKYLRTAKGLSQSELAGVLKYQYYNFVSQVENGRTRIPPEDIAAWAKEIGVLPKELAALQIHYWEPGYREALGEDGGGLVSIKRFKRIIENIREAEKKASGRSVAARSTC